MIAQKDKEISELQKSIREDKRIADDENEHPSERGRARERITEKREQIDALENEREELEESASPRESQGHLQKVWIHSGTRPFGSWYSHRSDR